MRFRLPRIRLGKQKIFLLLGLLFLSLGVCAALLYKSPDGTYNDDTLSVTYPVWAVTKFENGVSTTNVTKQAEIEIARQDSSNLPAQMWLDEIVSAIEKNTGLTKQKVEESSDVIIVHFSGKRAEIDVAAETQILNAGEFVYTLTYMSSAERSEENKPVRDKFFGSVQVLKRPVVSSFDLLGEIIHRISSDSYLIGTEDGELLTLVTAADTKIFKGKSIMEPDKIAAGMRFGAEGDISGNKINTRAIIFLED